MRRLSVAQPRTIAQQALEQVGLTDLPEFYPHRLSGGMHRRAAVARALAFDPDHMLMDEPFAALDEEMREELQGQLWHETQTQKTFVYVTHSVHEAVYLVDRVIVLTRDPTRIRGVITVDLPHPRDRLSDEFHARVKAGSDSFDSTIERCFGTEIMRTVMLVSLILAMLTAMAAAQDAIKFGYPQTPAGALAVVADKAVGQERAEGRVDRVRSRDQRA